MRKRSRFASFLLWSLLIAYLLLVCSGLMALGCLGVSAAGRFLDALDAGNPIATLVTVVGVGVVLLGLVGIRQSR